MKSNIRKLRVEKNNITQMELADAIGVSQQIISRMERDRNKIQVESLIAIADYFQVSTDMVLGYKPEKNSTREAKEQQNINAVPSKYFDDKMLPVIYDVLVGIKEYLKKMNT